MKRIKCNMIVPQLIKLVEVFFMNEKGMDFKHKEVINITDAKRLGYVQDVCADLGSGAITSMMVP